MSLYGARWKIDGIYVASVRRETVNGRYSVLIEREFAELPQIEAINWTHPMIEKLVDYNEPGLPDGYGFEVEKITYDSSGRSYTVHLRTSNQYLGDVTGYQEQIQQLETEIAEKNATIVEQENQINNTAEEMWTAYEEGVESVG